MSDVSEVLTRIAQQSAEPWRGVRARRRAAAQHVQKLFAEAAKEKEGMVDLFVGLAKDGLLSAPEVLVLTHLLLGSEGDKFFLAHSLLCAEFAEAVRLHNWFVAEAIGNDFLERYGSLIEALEWPLFPADRRFMALNTRLLSIARSTQGGGSQMAQMFRRDTEAGGTVPLVQLQDGSYAADVSAIETFANKVNNELSELRRLIKRPNTGRANQGTHGSNNAFSSNNGYNSTNNSGRGRGRQPRGGDFPPPPPPPGNAPASPQQPALNF